METTLKSKSSPNFIVILCGGSGPRLWPLSRTSNPKQFLNILSPDSLLSQTVNRALKIVPIDHIYIVTNRKYSQKIKKHTPANFPPQNIILEPQKKNTLMAMLYTSLLIEKKYPQATISFFPSDHFIKRQIQFSRLIKKSFNLAKTTDSIVIFGIKPTSINSSYGHIQVKDKQADFYTIKKFYEKPNPATIKKISQNNTVFWNSGIYTFTVKTLIDLVEKHQPQYSFNLIDKNISRAYQKCPNLSIDVGISQKTNRILLIPATFFWSDIGEWGSIHQLLRKNANQISLLTKDSLFLSIDSQNCLISGSPQKLIGLVGVKNLAIIDTPQGLLICHLNKSSSVRDLVGQMVSHKHTASYFLDKYDPSKTS